MIFRPFGYRCSDSALLYFVDDLPSDEASAIADYLRASREVKTLAVSERRAYQHYASVQFGCFYMQQEVEQDAN